MSVEGDDRRRHSRPFSLINDTTNQELMSTMHPIKESYGCNLFRQFMRLISLNIYCIQSSYLIVRLLPCKGIFISQQSDIYFPAKISPPRDKFIFTFLQRYIHLSLMKYLLPYKDMSPHYKVVFTFLQRYSKSPINPRSCKQNVLKH